MQRPFDRLGQRSVVAEKTAPRALGGKATSTAGGVYCCRYESRRTGCGGTGWKEWESEFVQFNIDDYKADWSPERVCDQFSGSDTECSATCCINVQFRNTELSSGGC